MDLRSDRLGDGDREYTGGGLQAAFLGMAFFEPGEESIIFAQTVLAAGFKACKGCALAGPFKVTSEGVEELMGVREVVDREVVG